MSAGRRFAAALRVNPRRRFAAALGCAFRLVAMSALLSACKPIEPPIATLTAKSGQVEYNPARRGPDWRRAALGENLWLGDGLRTFARGYAELALEPAGTLRVQANTTVHIANRAGAAVPQQVSVETGEVEVESASVEIELRMHGELARIEPGSFVRVRRTNASTRFEVQVGKINIERGDEHRTLAKGETFELLVGKPLVEPEAPVSAPAVDASAVTADAPRFDPALGRAELSLVAGESATLHHPQPPVRVRIAFAGCPGELAVESAHGSVDYGEQRVRGRGAAVLRLASGQHRYRVLCMNGEQLAALPAAEGVLRVREDTGTRRLSAAAPQATVDADGRRYTVRYPNLPPALTLRWPNAPRATSYSLRIEPERGQPRSQNAQRPNVALPPGTLPEGTHRFWFEAGAARSPLGSVRVEFDHSGRAASLSSPVDHGFAAGADTEVKGSVVAGASVSIEGAKVAVDPSGHFQTHIHAPIATDALAVRVQHPATGIHYYLRRVSHAEP